MNNRKDQLSSRLSGIAESATLKLNATVQQMKASGQDVVNFSAGEPDFFVPEVAKEAILESLKLNRSKYTPVPGIPELRQAVANKTNLQQPSLKEPWKAAHVVVSNGGKQALFNAMMALIDPSDEVLIPSPYWLSYPEMAKIAGGEPKLIETSLKEGFKLTPAKLEEALGPKSRILILNSPSNPTGAMYTHKEFAALAEVLESPQGKNVWVLSDEIYDRIVFGKVPFCSFLGAAPQLADRTLTLNGMSKSAAMTGWRIGWSVGPLALTQAMITLQGQSTSGINSLAQWASLAALKLPESHFSDQIESFKRRRDLIVGRLGQIAGLKLFIPDGAFYTFVGIEHYLNPGEDSIAFSQRVLEQCGVALVPGTPFGAPDFVRLSFAIDDQAIEQGCDRLIKYLTTQ